MAAHNPAAGPNPALIFETLNAYLDTMALKGAIDLELFTHISDGAATATEIATRCGGTERGVRILCDFLTIMGFLTREGAAYGLAPVSAAFLSKRSPAYLGSMANFLVNEDHFKNFQDLPAVVRKGGTVAGDGNMSPENPVWVEFARSMAPMMAMPAQILASMVATPGKPMKVIDIAAGHGLYGIAVARHNPAAVVVGVDWKNVLTVAIENASNAGVADRYSTIAGSAFDVDLGSGYDLALVPNFLHHFDPPANVTFLKKLRAAMNPGAVMATLEMVPNEDRLTPPVPARFSMMMLGSTPGGDAYTFRQFDQMFREAGFGASTVQDMPFSPEQLILTAV